MTGQHLRFVSCGIDAVYGANNSFPEPQLVTGGQVAGDGMRWGITKVTEVFAPATYGTPFSPVIFAQRDSTTRRMESLYTSIAIKSANPAVLVAIDQPWTFGSIILGGSEADRRIVYETYRPNDRPAVSLPGDGASPQAAPVDRCFFLASAGSFNYGHFLVDDMPRIKALDTLDRGLAIAMVSYGTAIDGIRAQAIQGIAGEREIVWLDRHRLYRFRQLFHVTPVSVHPTHKHPLALDWVVRAALTAAGALQDDCWRRLLVVRRPDTNGRTLINQATVMDLARRLGHEVVHAEDHDFLDQVRLFAQARLVAGQMGAAMTNAVFCSARTPVIHLAPDGWTEPFYWDLAMTRRQDYRILFGNTPEGDDVPVHHRNFCIDPNALAALLC